MLTELLSRAGERIAGKFATGVQRGKTCNCCQSRGKLLCAKSRDRCLCYSHGYAVVLSEGVA